MTEEEATALLNKYFPAYGWKVVGYGASGNVRFKSNYFCKSLYFELSIYTDPPTYLYVRGADAKTPYGQSVYELSNLINEMRLALIYLARDIGLSNEVLTTELLKRSSHEE